MSYETFTNAYVFEKFLTSYPWSFLAFDECHGWEDPDSATSRHVRLLRDLSDGALRLVGVSGTLFGSSLANACNVLHLLGLHPQRTVESVAASVSRISVRRSPPHHWLVHSTLQALPLSRAQRDAYDRVMPDGGAVGGSSAAITGLKKRLLPVCQWADDDATEDGYLAVHYPVPMPGDSDAGQLKLLLAGSAKLSQLHVYLASILPSHARVVVVHASDVARRLLESYCLLYTSPSPRDS